MSYGIFEIGIDLLPKEDLAHSNPLERYRIKESIESEGLKNPLEIYVDIRRIIIAKGNQRLRCLKELGRTKVPVKLTFQGSHLVNEILARYLPNGKKEGMDNSI